MRVHINASGAVLKHLEDDPNLYRAAEIFTASFRINHAHSEAGHEANSFGYLFLSPDAAISQSFNINREVLFYVDESTAFTSRAFATIVSILDANRTRLTQDIVFVASQDPRAPALCAEHLEQTGRKFIHCNLAEIQAGDQDFAAELLRRFLYSRDLFDVRDPVSSDDQFFARFRLVDELHDALLHGHSSGVFGLRKIGKTSVLKRLRMKNEWSRSFQIAYIDAQQPTIYDNDPAGIAFEIVAEFNRTYARAHSRPFQRDLPTRGTLVDASRFLNDFLSRLLASTSVPLLVIFDELERILPTRSPTNKWNTQYVHLWRLLRAESQSKPGKFVFLVASTNPYFVEEASVAQEDNPLYRFIKPRFLNPFSIGDLTEMVEKLGRPMGVGFDGGAVEAIHAWFGGHPFLSRQLCSAIARDLPERPLNVTERDVELAIRRHASHFRVDLDAILKVFSDYYPEERQVLQELAKDERKAVKALDERPLAGQHLLGYGLIRRTKGSYRFCMEALPKYLVEVPPTEYKSKEIPDEVRTRHLLLQQRLNQIEPALRMLVLGRLQGEFGKEWFRVFQMKASERERIESKGDLNNLQLMEETFLSDLLSTILHHWKLFLKVFVSRQEFQKQQRRLIEIARNSADHRKFQICADDAQYLAASEACEWFEERILR
jgi:hypothetical protein